MFIFKGLDQDQDLTTVAVIQNRNLLHRKVKVLKEILIKMSEIRQDIKKAMILSQMKEVFKLIKIL